jgi:hypothetical protein
VSDSEWHGEPHTLIVHEVVRLPDGHFDDGELDYDIEHPPSCAQEDYGHAGRFKVMAWTCDVASHVIEGGLEFSLNYSGTPITEPGTYQIQGWGRKTYYHEYGAYEYDGGVGVVEPEASEASGWVRGQLAQVSETVGRLNEIFRDAVTGRNL